MSFFSVTRINNPTSIEEEPVYVNLNEVKYFSAHAEGGASLFLVHEELPMQVKEPCEDLMMQLRSETTPGTA